MFGRLISSLGIAAIQGEISGLVRRLKLRLILAAIAAVMWLLVVIFALATVTVWLASLVGPIAACAILAGLFAVLAIAIHIVMRLVKRRRPSLASSLSKTIAPLKEAVEQPEGASAPPGAAGAAASTGALLVLAAIGYAVGRSVTGR